LHNLLPASGGPLKSASAAQPLTWAWGFPEQFSAFFAPPQAEGGKDGEHCH